jgi:putative FmdB family regulatory protein
MPTYEYEPVDEAPSDCPQCGEVRFEVRQTFAEASLATCPQCGRAVRRVFSAPNIQGAGRSAETLSNKGLAEKGFTKYVKAGDGHYEKVAGKGPNVFKK